MKKPRPRKTLSPELEELRVGLIGVLPKIGNELGSMLGRKFPRASARDRAGLERKLDQFMRATAPHIKTLEELKDKPDVDLERFVALDQFLTGLLKSAGQKLRPDADPWQAYLQLCGEASHSAACEVGSIPRLHPSTTGPLGFPRALVYSCSASADFQRDR